MQKGKLTKSEYVKLLEEHFDLTQPYKKLYVEPRLNEIEKTVNTHREKFSMRNPKLVLASVLAFQLLSSIVMGVIIIKVINDILGFAVAYSLKNIVVISSVFLLSKMKLKFYDNS